MSSNALLWPSQGTIPEQRLDKYKYLKLPSQGVGEKGVIPLPSIPLLDVFPGARFAYSLRLMRTAYLGAAIRVKRTSDNTTQDIGFVNGRLDVAALQAFVGSSDGLITILFDQTGNGFDLDAQTDDSKMPKIIIAGILQTSNVLESLNFDGVDDVLFGTLDLPALPAQTFNAIVWQKLDLLNIPVVWNMNQPFTANRYSMLNVVILLHFDAGNTGPRRSTATVTNDLLQHVDILSKASILNGQIIRRDGVLLDAVTEFIASNGVKDIALGGLGDGETANSADMQCQEFVYYDIDVQSDITGIEKNIRDYYNGIFLLVANNGDRLVTNAGENLVYN